MSDIEFTANQLIHHIGIGVARVDQVHPILQAVALGVDLLQFLPMSGQCPAIIAPSQYSVGAKPGVSREQRPDDNREGRSESGPQKRIKFSDLGRAEKRSVGKECVNTCKTRSKT